jgi:UDP-N-acetylmuramate dehydrogenase
VSAQPAAAVSPSVLAAARSVLGDAARVDVALGAFTTFRIGGPAAVFVEADTEETLERVADARAASGLEVVMIGQGSNLLIADGGVGAIVVRLGAGFETIEVTEPDPVTTDRTVIAGAAVKLPVLARRAAALGVAGLGWMVGVPGSVGGAVRMNAGGHGSDVRADLDRATVFDLDAPAGSRRVVRAADTLALAYRSSALLPNEVVIDAAFRVRNGDRDALDRELSEIVRWRRAHQPGGANCGSVFTNPAGDSAGRLIDAAGLRGQRLGSASVSEKHANFIQADDAASCTDVWNLILHIRRVVFERFGVVLHPEVRTAGFAADLPQLAADP